MRTRLSSRRARTIRRRCQKRSQNRNGLGVSELFLARPADAIEILATSDQRLKAYLLGFDLQRFRRLVSHPA